MKLRSKLWLGMGAAFLALFALFEWNNYSESRANILSELREQALILHATLMATRRTYQHAFLESGLSIDERTLNFLPAHTMSRISQNFNLWMRNGMTFNNVSDRPRNPANQADAIELEAMAYFRSSPKSKERFVPFTAADGSAYYHYSAPIWVEQYCLKCHGDPADAPEVVRDRYPAAFGYRVGDLRGLMSIKVPVSAVEERIMSVWRQQLFQQLLLMLAAFVSVALLTQLFVIRKLKRIRHAADRLAAGDLRARAELPGGDELARLGGAFDGMAEAIAARALELREREELVRLLLESTAQAIYGIDHDGRCTFANRACARLLGYTDSEELMGRDIHALIHHHHDNGDAYPHDACPIGHSLREERPIHIDHEVFWRADGVSIPVEYWAYPMRRSGKVVGTVVTFFDISERLRDEAKSRLATTVFESTHEGIMITDPHSRILAVNQAFTRVTGYEEDEVVGQTPVMLRSGRHDPDFYAVIWRALREAGHWQGEIWNRRKSGEVYPELLSISAVHDSQGSVSHYVGMFTDISKIKESEARLAHLAHYDPLTDLPNRLLLSSRLRHAIEHAQRQQTRLAVLFLDLDRFKNVNDSLGHQVGDELLRAVTDRMGQRLRAEDTLARLGGDEFIALLERIHEPRDAAMVARSLLEALAEPFTLSQGHEVYIGASIGISLYPEDGDSDSELIMHADVAMYQAKDQGRNAYGFYTQALTDNANQRLEMETKLRRALERGEFVLHFQPQVGLADGGLIGAEVLVRWLHPVEGLIPPNQFIPLAEETGLIVPLGEWVLRKACEQWLCWRDIGLTPVPLAVNISPRQFRQQDFAQVVRRVLEETGVPASALELELTEGALMHQGEDAEDALRGLKELGVGLAIDDFGTGYSSLAYLKRFPLDQLKIDQSFVRDLTHDTGDRELVSTIIAMARKLRLKVLAEGVETREQFSYLVEQGCDAYQGYLYSRPVPAAEFEVLLRERNM
ncbi:MAG: EAL domain-containing protein [Betaproteobacteria bacterium]|nr:EAL domain-containing protein [Betaproteobacteria bacterium]